MFFYITVSNPHYVNIFPLEFIMNCISRNLLLIFNCCVFAGCATQTSFRETSEVKDAPSSPAKKAASELLLQKKRIVLEGKATDGGLYTIYFYPQEGEVKVNLSKNVCFPIVLPARFSINKFDNVSIQVEGMSKEVWNCPVVRFNIDPITGVAGEFTYYLSTQKWSTSSNRFYLKND